MGCLSKPHRSYYPTIVWAFFTNYLATLDKDCSKRSNIADMRIRMRILFRGVMMDISARTINQILFGKLYMIPTITLELEHQMTKTHNQWPWIAWVLTYNGDPSWMRNWGRIIKSSLRFRAKFWWAIFWLRLMLTGGDTNFDL